MSGLSQQARASAVKTSALPIGELTSALDQQTASKINDAVREDGAFVHAENKYEAEFQGGQPLQMAFKTRNDDGKHVVTKVVKGGIAEQQGLCVGHQLVAFGGKSFDGMSEQQVTREIKESTFTGKLEFIGLKEDGGVDLPGAPTAAVDGNCNFPGGALMLGGWKKGAGAGVSRLGPPGVREVEQKLRATPIKSAEQLAAELGKLTFTNTVEESHRRKGNLDEHRGNSIEFCPRLGFLDSAQARILMSTETVQELVALSKDGALAGLTSGGGFFYGQNVKIQEYKGPLAKMTEFASLKICNGEQNESGEEAVVAVVDDTGGNFFLSRPLPTADYAKSRVIWLQRLFDLLRQEVTTQVLAACDYFAQVDGDYTKILSYDDKNGGPAGGFCLQALLVGQNVWLWDKIRHEGRTDDIDCIQREKRLSEAWVEAMLKRLEGSMQTVQVVLRCQEADLRKQRFRWALVTQLVILRGALARYQTGRFESPECGMLSEKLEAFGGMTGMAADEEAAKREVAEFRQVADSWSWAEQEIVWRRDGRDIIVGIGGNDVHYG
jgi:hypothetical protein